ncbi:MAG: 30S ribosomal protein S7 [Patescibacteria group bacterium]
MRKRSSFKKNEIVGDSVHERIDMARFINYIMVGGEKSTAERVFYRALDEVKNITKGDPVEIFEKAIVNASPLLEVVSKRVGGANYQVPREVRPERKFFLASHWIIDTAKKKKGSPMAKRLAEELILASKNEGTAIKKKQDMHRMAEANRAFASYVR